MFAHQLCPHIQSTYLYILATVRSCDLGDEEEGPSDFIGMAKWLGRDKLDCGCEVCATDAKYCASEIPRLGFMVEDGTGNTKHVRQADAPRTLLAIVGAVSQGSKGFGLTAPVAVPRLRRRPPVAPRAGTTALLCSAELTRPANNVRARDVVSSRIAAQVVRVLNQCSCR